MNKKLNIHSSLKLWDEKSISLSKEYPLKTLSRLPKMEGITKDTARFLRIKSLWYLLRYDHKKIFLRFFFKNPITHLSKLLNSYRKKKSYLREGDFFYYGLKNSEEFIHEASSDHALLLVGFSYCHKPFECPSKRFSEHCIHDPEHPVCAQCFIGKIVNHLPSNRVIPLFIPTIHYIGEKLFESIYANPDKKILFLITACEMSLEMFGDWGNMVSAKGIGVRLDGRICNTMKAFELSEHGVKPGLTVVTEPTQEKILSIISLLHSRNSTTS